MQNIKKKTVNAKGDKIITCSDNKFLIKECHSEVKKVSNCTKEAGGAIEVT